MLRNSCLRLGHCLCTRDPSGTKVFEHSLRRVKALAVRADELHCGGFLGGFRWRRYRGRYRGMRGNLPAFSLNILASEIQHLLVRGVCEGARASILRPVDLSGVPSPHTYHVPHTRITQSPHARIACASVLSGGRTSAGLLIQMCERAAVSVPCYTYTRMCLGRLTRVCCQTACGGASRCTCRASMRDSMAKRAYLLAEVSKQAGGIFVLGGLAVDSCFPCCSSTPHTAHHTQELPPPPLGCNRASECR